MMSVAKHLPILIFICGVTSAFGQSSERFITEIRAEFQRINSNNNLKTIELNNEEFLEQITDGGGKLTGYFENGQLVKFTEWVGLSYGTNVTDYYLKNSKIFFAYQRENKFANKYDESGEIIGLDYSELKIEFEGRYYFNSDELIKGIEEGKRIFSREFEAVNFLKFAYETAELLDKRTIKN